MIQNASQHPDTTRTAADKTSAGHPDLATSQLHPLVRESLACFKELPPPVQPASREVSTAAQLMAMSSERSANFSDLPEYPYFRGKQTAKSAAFDVLSWGATGAIFSYIQNSANVLITFASIGAAFAVWTVGREMRRVVKAREQI